MKGYKFDEQFEDQFQEQDNQEEKICTGILFDTAKRYSITLKVDNYESLDKISSHARTHFNYQYK